MSGNALSSSVSLYRERLRLCLIPLLDEADRSLVEAHSAGEIPVVFLQEDEIRTAAECLLHLGLEQDFRRLVSGWKRLTRWVLGPFMDQQLAKWAAESPEEGQRLREQLGEFPSAEELANESEEDRERRNCLAGADLSGFVDHVRQLLETLERASGGRATGAPRLEWSSPGAAAPRPAATAGAGRQRSESAAGETPPATLTTLPITLTNHPDGPEAPHWLWLKNQRYQIGKKRSRISWVLLLYFWNRESATYEDLQGPGKPWPDPVTDSAVSTAANRFNTEMPSGFPWKLVTKGRCVARESRENPAK
jgi:hypothetical protein